MTERKGNYDTEEGKIQQREKKRMTEREGKDDIRWKRTI